MIATFTRWGGTLVAAFSAALSMQAPALAAGAPPAPLTLDKAFTAATGKTVRDQPASLRNCTTFPQGAKSGKAGWHFGQPVPGGQPSAYVIGFIETVNGKANSSLIAVVAGQLYRIEVNDRTTAGEFSPQDLKPAPDSVSGGLTGNGGWLTTPQDWRLASGALMVAGGTPGGRTTFALTAVCLSPSLSSPSPAPSRSSPSPARSLTSLPAATRPAGAARSPRPTGLSPSLSPSAGTAPVAAGMLPITGGRGGVVAVAGLAAVVAGLLMVTVRRRRERIRFRA